MDPLNSEALTGLTSALQSLLPASGDPDLAPELAVSPTHFAPTGLNGFVGVNHDPDGEIVGRRVKASAIVAVKTTTLDELNGAVAGVTAAVVGTARGDLRRLGILTVGVGELGDQLPPNGGPARQDVTFDVSYEFLKVPSAPEGVMQQIPIDLELSRGNEPRTLASGEFLTAAALADFEIVDDPLATKNTLSAWSFDAVGQRIQQTSTISGGTTAVNANKPGTYLVLKETPSRPAVADVILRAEVQSDGNQGIGLVFRYQDPANFCFFLANANKGYRLLAKKVAGSFQQIALDSTRSFTVGALTRLKVVAAGAGIEVSVDDAPALSGADPATVAPGRCGFMTFQNPQAFFYDIELISI